MVRVRRPEPVEPEEPQGPVMPINVVFNFGSDNSWPEFHEARDEWLREHSINPDDRTAVHAVVTASQRAQLLTRCRERGSWLKARQGVGASRHRTPA